ncbi:MAG: DUF1080 domain-containing protein [Phycisphaerales bacterium]|nr:MAG: DUF1080 domain-containing protein [Phycisphaerales bacterium]
MRSRRYKKSESFTSNSELRLLTILLIAIGLCASTANGAVNWQRKSTTTRDMPTPNAGNQQTCCLVLDIDKDGVEDFVVGERTQAPSVVWYKFNSKGWDKYVIDNTKKRPEAGGDFCDIDRDGDLDIVLGQDASGNNIWWWENPNPDFSKPWKCRNIKKSGASKHHDQTFGDFDGDGRVEFVSWNQRAKKLLLYDIPANPKTTGEWSPTAIYSWSSGREREGFPSIPTDIDLDGKVDIVGGGRWFKHQGGTAYEENVIDADMAFTQCAAGQLVKGGRPEVVFSPGDMNGDAKWYEWDGKKWVSHTLRHVIHGHTCEIRDVDADGNLDIFIGEMGKPGAGDNAKTYIWYGDGKGNFEETIASKGQGIHEGKLADLDGDGDLDILLKPYNHNSPRLDVVLNTGDGWEALFDGSNMDKWQKSRWVINRNGWLTRRKKSGMVWTKERFGDFILDLEFKTEGNSGIFFRTDNTKNPVQTGIEIQVDKRVAKPTTHSCGAVYDAMAPSKEMTKDGQWNHITIAAVDNKIDIMLNGEPIIDMDLNQWTEAGWNPGPPRTKNKFKTALKDFKREGHIGFQDHGADVWYRNIRIKRL